MSILILTSGDIVQRLRDWSEGPTTFQLVGLAADEIESLRAQLAAERERGERLLRIIREGDNG